MKKVVVLIVSCFLMAGLYAQDFDKYFENKTLRIEYLHIGDANSEKFELHEYRAGGVWSGTRMYLQEPNRYGDILVEVFDSISGEPIFSRSYSSLFNEYRATERALKETGSFEECINVPYPKKTILYTFTSFNRRGEGTVLYKGSYSPMHSPAREFSDDYSVMTLHRGGKPEECLDILLIPDGYTKEESVKMQSDLKRFSSYIMDCSPYRENAERVNIRAIKGYSKESGITDPNNNVYRNTLLGCTYNVTDVDRYLMCLNVWKMNDIADDAPYDAIIIITNSTKYGGGGIYNFYATVCSAAPEANFVIVHEMGHSIGGLADEYYTSEVGVTDYYPTDVEPVEPNLTTLVDFGSKWKSMLDPNTPVPTPATSHYKETLGVYEGGGYQAEGVYRPWQHCTMKEIIYNNFCPVCTKVLNDMFNYYSNREN
ncbi:MAG: hypothetical protein J5642_01860 [Bacteroidales bacterium]|nr:hypothetical protein [Bacteroidales bacterium]